MKKVLTYIKSKPLALTSIIILALFYFVMIFAPFFAPYSPTQTFEENTFHPANIHLTKDGFKVREGRVLNSITWKYAFVKDLDHDLVFFTKGSEYKILGFIPCSLHLFGTRPDENGNTYPVYLMGADNLGRDVFSRMIYGSQISLTIGFVATFISLIIAILLGGISGFYGGKTDWTIMRLSEFFMLIPGLYLILFLRSLLNTKMDSGMSYMIITLILSLVSWPGSARTIRGIVHSLKREEFVINAQLEGIPSATIIIKQIIPQMTSLLIVSTALSVPGFIMSETTLSYLGLGIADPAVSWGSMINREISTLSNLSRYPWLLNPVWALLLVTLAFNFLGDALRDFFDPYHVVFPTWKRKKMQAAAAKQMAMACKNDEQRDSCINTTQLSEIGKTDVILQVRDLKITFINTKGKIATYTNAVKGVSFDVCEGEILGLVGESGSGKSVSTTAIPCLLPLNAYREGQIYFRGKELTAMSDKELHFYRGKKIGMIFQEPGRSFDPLQNIGNIFLEVYRNVNKKITKEEALDKAEKLLDEVGIKESRSRLANYPHQFSGGQLQRIGIALSLAQGCELLIADEPTTALDVTIQAQIVELLLKLKNTRHLSIVFISHNIELVAQISDRINVMYQGLIVESDVSKKIMQNPEHPYTKALLAAIPKFGEHYTTVKLSSIPQIKKRNR